MNGLDDIRIALENHLATMTYASGLPSIAWPNVPFTRPENAAYIQVSFRPVTNRPSVIGPDPQRRRSGLFMVTVYTPEMQGAAEGAALAAAIESRFAGSTVVTGTNALVSIEYAEVKSPLHATPFFAIPVEIGWYAFA